MKVKERQKAIDLRKRGISMGEIAKSLNVAKSSVSYWVRDIKLSSSQLKTLNKNGHSIGAIEKRRVARIGNTKLRRELIMKEAVAETKHLQTDPLWCIGVSLYWGEGGKTQQTARLSNSDPIVIKIIMQFFRQFGSASEDSFRAHVHTFSHKNASEAVAYWSKISGIPKNRFYKTYIKQSSASKMKRETLPYGTVQVYFHDSPFFFRLMGWIQGIKSQYD